MARRQRVDSISGAIAVAKASKDKSLLLPPEHNPLPDGAMPFWNAIVCGRAREEWAAAPALLSSAASLAWVQWQIADLRCMIDGSRPVRAGLKVAGLGSQMNELQRLEMAYLRTLQQNGRAVAGEVRDVATRRAATRELEGALADGDDLLN